MAFKLNREKYSQTKTLFLFKKKLNKNKYFLKKSVFENYF